MRTVSAKATWGETMKNYATSIILILIVVLLVGIVLYNKLVSRDETLSRAWTPLLGALQKRYDAVPKLVNEIILYNANEDDQVRSLAASYKAFSAAQGMDAQVTAANDLEHRIEQMLLEAATRYPGIEGHFEFQALKRNFQQSTEEMKPAAMAYNKAAEDFNVYVRSFPNDIVAKLAGLKHENFYFKEMTPVEPKPGDTM